ncbi:MAG: 50S ribosomal protein L2 [Candidatus Komeilibacteria bacterium CG_4_10_14_0_2_um_filter_37_10]|uniref:Large ribosomal subunit protein uL2 n=1 Tax=Candidatus Komeilibacteria bacterium CG_4_10_14_0_2_um_filter_37_10 TaxID=1974470 RepID=A0A2M7VEB6_9BACT|nr:MAG: 50S ribosomal protein L2 [Candidatus Komeilibacteria bacterium CG_4_10_14_0_2_um_filter_37_10]
MSIKLYKPTTPARRHMSSMVTDVSKKLRQNKNLRYRRMKTGGRNNQGKITVRHIGGGNKQFVRMVDFQQLRYDVPAKILQFEYDPIRNAKLALIRYQGGVDSYILAAEKMKVNDQVITSRTKFSLGVGNRFPLELIPTGQMVYNIEIEPGRGGKMVRGAGTGATLMVVEGKYATLRLPSGEVRKVVKECLASLGQVSNQEYRNIRWSKAGRVRHLGIKPTVRGKAMNPVDHPHGGGEAKNSIGLVHPKTPWGKPALGVKTRNTKKFSTKLIIQRRSKRK